MSNNNALAKFRNRFSRSFNSKTESSADGSEAPTAPVNIAQQQPESRPMDPSVQQPQAPSAADSNVASPKGDSIPHKQSEKATGFKTVAAGVSAKAAPPPPSKDETPPEPAPTDLLPNHSSSARSLGPPKSKLRQLYPEIEPYRSGKIRVSSEEDGSHELYWELSGKEGGYPVVFLHGGPGGGCSADDRRWFDPQHYQILTFDQRGAGKSTPAAELKANTTWDLVSDIEKLRQEVAKVEKWHVFGGSWGSTLSLAYAQKHPDRVSALILRGIFSLRRSELLFFYQQGSNYIWPEQFEPYQEHIPEAERDDMIAAYYKRLTSEDAETRLAAARRWATWENATSKLYLDQKNIAKGDDDIWSLQFARIESHFFHNRGWMEDGALLAPENVAKIAHIPTVIVQGRYDVVCPMKTCWDLRNAWLKAQNGRNGNLELFIIPDAGHASREPGVTDKLLYATDKYRAIK